MVLLHEQEHTARGDLWQQWLARIVAALYWFYPLVWWLIDQLVEVRELATDSAVVARLGGDGRDYAIELVKLAEGSGNGCATRQRSYLTAAAMAGDGGMSSLELQVRSLLSSVGCARTGGRISALLLGLLIFLFVAVSCCTPERHRTSGWSDDELRLRLTADLFPGE